jgi:AbrB family looped-hinge helix DNA binding protein
VTVDQMSRLTEGLPSKSAKIRALAKAGCQRADIARFLDIRYQHVRKVLVDEKVREAKALASAAGVNGAAGVDHRTLSARVRVGPDGRLVVPAQFRETLGLKEGDVLFARLENGEISLLTAAAAIKRIQAKFAPYRRPDVSEVDAFLAERRKMWGEEDNNG